MSLGILGGEYGELKRLGLAARAEALALRKEVDALKRQMKSLGDGFGTQSLHAIFGEILILTENMTPAAGVLIDGRDIDQDGVALDAAVSDIAVIESDISDLQTGLATGTLWLPVSAMANRDGVVINYSNNQECATLNATTSAASRLAGSFIIPADFEAATTPDLYAHHVVLAAGGTNGQDVVYRINTATSASGEATGTNGAQTDVTIDIPNATQNTYYRSPLINDLANVTALDLLTIHFDRRGADAADTLVATTGLIGFELVYTRNVS